MLILNLSISYVEKFMFEDGELCNTYTINVPY